MQSVVVRFVAAVFVALAAGCNRDILLPIPNDDTSVPILRPPAPFQTGEPPGLHAAWCSPVGSERACYSGDATLDGVGQCHAGVMRCDAMVGEIGQWSACQDEGVPEAERCDGIDNDCDGLTDEDLGATTCGQGACRHTVLNCSEAAAQTCDPLAGASPEVCDGLDNDCDGDIDEGLGDERIACGIGQCAHTVTACDEGGVPSCDPLALATTELCDGLDNDCDGDVDEGLGTVSCGVGLCTKTIAACAGGVGQFCDPFGGAALEVCDGEDNDCDGQTDEDQGTLSCGTGQCEKSVAACLGGSPQSCDPMSGSTVELCDGRDNDCDGLVDDGLGTLSCGLGICEKTGSACVGGITQSCDPFAGAGAETCDGLDNDCDGQTDEGLGSLACGAGQCAKTVTACLGGVPQTCDPFAGASTETCDGLDNDCDGQTDEGLGTISCGLGQCENTVAACLGGVPQSCDSFAGASAETCDGLDNDCDGQTDEDLGFLSCGLGQCEKTVAACSAGVTQSCDPLAGATPEICGDGIDNDCDGITQVCVESFLVGAETHARSIDVVWSVDSSGSMSVEMANVESNINQFADTLEAAGSANALHLISDRGLGDFEICVQPPLAGLSCSDNPPRFFQYDTNGADRGSMVHSSNALGRVMQQVYKWGPRLQSGAHIAFIVTTDDDGDDPAWGAPKDDSEQDDCSSSNYITDGTRENYCRWNDPDDPVDYTSLADDFAGLYGFKTFMAKKFPNAVPGVDWTFYPIIAATGANGLPKRLQFSCPDAAETGDEYVKLAQFTGTEESMTPLCAVDWDLSSIAESIVDHVPQDSFTLVGNPSCASINPATLKAYVNGTTVAGTDWSFDAATCVLKFISHTPSIGDVVQFDYDNY